MGRSVSHERAEQIQRLFDAVVEMDPQERAARLDQSCAGDAELRREVEALLEAFDYPASDVRIALEALQPTSNVGRTRDLTGQTVTHYRIEEKLGAGGMGVVYRARDLRLGRTVALKFLPLLVADDEEAKRRFVQEAQAASALDHPNIAVVHDFGKTDSGELFIAMTCYEGATLKQKIANGPLPIAEALNYALQIAQALERAHAHQILHRDVKPANVIVTEDHLVKLLDFGLAKMTGSHLTQTGVTLGTAAYMSPEQASGDAVDHRTDIWSLGVVLYEMLAGERPFEAEHTEAVLYRILHDEPNALRSHREDVPAELQAVVEDMLAKRPADRYQQADEVIARLKAIRKQIEGRKTTRPRRRVKSAGLAAVAILLLAFVLSVFVLTPAPAGSISSVVVLPFENLSGDVEQTYFVDGVHEAVIGELQRSAAFEKIISPTSARRYKSTTKSLPEIAGELQVDGVVAGSVLRVDDQVRVNVQLIEGSTDRLLWSDSYERDFEEILALQADIGLAVASEIEGNLAPAEVARLGQAGEPYRPDSAAYEAYLRGQYWAAQWPDSGRAAIRYLEEATRRNPRFAAAFGALAMAYLRQTPVEPERQPEPGEKAERAARTALALDRSIAEAHTALGYAHMHKWDWAASEASFREALGTAPNSAVAHQWFSQLLRQTRRLDEALHHARRAMEIDPLSVSSRTMVGWVLWNQGRDQEAIEVWNGVLELDPSYGLAMYNKGLAFATLGRPDDVLDAARRLEAVGFHVGSVTFLDALGHAIRGDRDRVEDYLPALDSLRPGLDAVVYQIAGDDEAAFQSLEQSVADRHPWIPNITSEPWFDDVRDDPRFRRVRAKMGLPLAK